MLVPPVGTLTEDDDDDDDDDDDNESYVNCAGFSRLPCSSLETSEHR